MKTYERIRMLREAKHLTQEDMAGRLSLSPNGYAKIERGETRLNLPRLEQIADIFEIDIVELIQPENNCWHYVGNHNSNSDISFYASSVHDLAAEMEKLRLSLRHKDELLAQQADELKTLKEMLALLKQHLG